MYGQVGFDQKASDAELIALVRGTQCEIEAHNVSPEVHALLCAFAEELLKQRLLAKMNFARPMELVGVEVVYSHDSPFPSNGHHGNLSARATEAFFVVSGTIRRFRERLPIVRKQAKAYFQRVQDLLARLEQRVAEEQPRLKEVFRTGESDLRAMLTRTFDVIAHASEQIRQQFTKVLAFALKHTKAYFQQTQGFLARLEHRVAEERKRLQEALRTRQNDLRALLGRAFDVIAHASGEIRQQFTKVLAFALKHTKAYFQQTQGFLARLEHRVAEERKRLQEALRTRQNDLRALLAGSFNAASEEKPTILRSQTQLPVVTKRKPHIRQAQSKITKLRRTVVDKSQKSRAKENDLRELLATSQDAIVVTSTDHRFVAANPNGLKLFGISEINMSMFTIDAFLSRGQIPLFDETGPRFAGRKQGCGECEIRRLDGSLGIVEYDVTPNYAPFLHLCRFHNYRKGTLRRRLLSA